MKGAYFGIAYMEKKPPRPYRATRFCSPSSLSIDVQKMDLFLLACTLCHGRVLQFRRSQNLLMIMYVTSRNESAQIFQICEELPNACNNMESLPRFRLIQLFWEGKEKVLEHLQTVEHVEWPFQKASLFKTHTVKRIAHPKIIFSSTVIIFLATSSQLHLVPISPSSLVRVFWALPIPFLGTMCYWGLQSRACTYTTNWKPRIW
jgi:hypothetical protein